MFTLKDPSLFKSQCFLNGEWIDADNGAVIAVDNPATGEIIGSVPRCGSAETRRAIEAASAAWFKWRALRPHERASFLLTWHELIQKHKEDLARILTLEQGKPVSESLGEIALGSSYIPWYAEECRRTYGDVVPTPRRGVRPITHMQPVGPVCAITPWNFPISIIIRKVAPALAAGCPVIVKPASSTPYSAFALAELARKSGFPSGTYNVLTGSAAEIGREICNNPKVRKISFTGSTEIGKQLVAHASCTMKRMSMELGGNAPFIVFNDADMEQAVAGCISAKFRNAGQTCICANRIFVQKEIYEEFAYKLTEKVRAFKIGNGFEPGTEIGPLINSDAVAFVDGLVHDAVKKGAEVLAGGQLHSLGGNYYQPTVLRGVTRAMRLFDEEIFGPIAPLMVFESEKEAIALSNDTSFGLASYIYTRDLGRAWRVSEALEYGLVGVNEVALAMAEAPFGGVKESGMGREGGWEGLKDYMETRYVLMGGIGA